MKILTNKYLLQDVSVLFVLRYALNQSDRVQSDDPRQRLELFVGHVICLATTRITAGRAACPTLASHLHDGEVIVNSMNHVI